MIVETIERRTLFLSQNTEEREIREIEIEAIRDGFEMVDIDTDNLHRRVVIFERAIPGTKQKKSRPRAWIPRPSRRS